MLSCEIAGGAMDTEAGTLSHLIGEIYDAVLDSGLWIRTLEKCCGFLEGGAAAIFSKDTVSKTGAVAFSWGIDRYYRDLYLNTYVTCDPMTNDHFSAEIEEPVTTADLMPYSEFLDTRFYKEWAQPQGWVDCVSVPLDKSSTSVTLFNVFRHQRHGLVDGVMLRRTRLLVPHVRRAVLIGDVIGVKKTEVATLADTFDELGAGIFLVTLNANIVFSNIAGQSMLDSGKYLRSVQGALTVNEPKADDTLRGILAAAGAGDGAVEPGGIAVLISNAPDERWIAHVLPLTSGARRRAGVAHSVVAAVFVRKASPRTPSPMETIAKVYKLTRSELRVLGAVIDVGGVSAVAEALGISDATVKTHLQNLFEKTGVHRQGDLIKLVVSYVSPFSA